MYKFERAKDTFLEIGFADEVFKVKVGGMEALKRYFAITERYSEVAKKFEAFQKENKQPTEELITLLGDITILMFKAVLGDDIADKMIDFYEGNYDEMLTAIVPWIQKEWLPAVRNKAKEDSMRKAGLETL